MKAGSRVGKARLGLVREQARHSLRHHSSGKDQRKQLPSEVPEKVR